MFNNSNPNQFQKLASVPIEECSVGNGFIISCLCYDQEQDVLRISMSSAGQSNNGNYREMSLMSEVLESSSNLTEVPSFVKVRQIDADAGSISNMHLDKATSQVFFICDDGYFATSTSTSGSTTEFKPYTTIHDGANGNFMGFQPSLSPDTFILLQSNGIYPI